MLSPSALSSWLGLLGISWHLWLLGERKGWGAAGAVSARCPPGRGHGRGGQSGSSRHHLPVRTGSPRGQGREELTLLLGTETSVCQHSVPQKPQRVWQPAEVQLLGQPGEITEPQPQHRLPTWPGQAAEQGCIPSPLPPAALGSRSGAASGNTGVVHPAHLQLLLTERRLSCPSGLQ